MKKKTAFVTALLTALLLFFAGMSVRTILIKRGIILMPAPEEAAAGGGGGAVKNAQAVRVSEVTRGTIENSVIINGDVLPERQVSLYPAVAGKAAEIRFRVGERIRKGDIAAMIDPSRPGELYSYSPVISPVDGTVLQIPVNSGDTVTLQTALCLVGDLSSLVIETYLPERFVNAARPGLGAQVSLESLPGEVFNASVYELSPVLDPASRTLRIRLRFSGASRDSRIKAGMFATVTLVTNTRRDVPVIPREAVINTYGSWIVFIVDEGNVARRREITPGLESETLLEVTGGVEPGERIVVQGQNFLSDGDPVRIVE